MAKEHLCLNFHEKQQTWLSDASCVTSHALANCSDPQLILSFVEGAQ